MHVRKGCAEREGERERERGGCVNDARVNKCTRFKIPLTARHPPRTPSPLTYHTIHQRHVTLLQELSGFLWSQR
jgi:hypothetical protein